MSETVRIPVDTGVVVLSAKVFAESAFEHDIDINSFTASLNNFSDEAHKLGISTDEEIMQWREEATEHYFKLMQEAGKLKHVEQEFFGGSDYACDEDAAGNEQGENEDDPSCSK